MTNRDARNVCKRFDCVHNSPHTPTKVMLTKNKCTHEDGSMCFSAFNEIVYCKETFLN